MTAGPDAVPAISVLPVSQGPPERPGRLRKRPEFLAVAKGRRFHTERLTVQALPRSRDPDAGLRIGFTVTRREGHSTERNRIRRRLRAAAARAAEAHLQRPLDVVIVGRAAVIAAPFALLVDDLATALGRLGAAPKSPGRTAPRSPHVQ